MKFVQLLLQTLLLTIAFSQITLKSKQDFVKENSSVDFTISGNGKYMTQHQQNKLNKIYNLEDGTIINIETENFFGPHNMIHIPGTDEVLVGDTTTTLKKYTLPNIADSQDITLSTELLNNYFYNQKAAQFFNDDGSILYLLSDHKIVKIEVSDQTTWTSSGAKDFSSQCGSISFSSKAFVYYSFFAKENKVTIQSRLQGEDENMICVLDLSDWNNLTSQTGVASSTFQNGLFGGVGQIGGVGTPTGQMTSILDGKVIFTYDMDPTKAIGSSYDGKYWFSMSGGYDLMIVQQENPCKYQKSTYDFESFNKYVLFSQHDTFIVQHYNYFVALKLGDTWETMSSCTKNSASLKSSDDGNSDGGNQGGNGGNDGNGGVNIPSDEDNENSYTSQLRFTLFAVALALLALF